MKDFFLSETLPFAFVCAFVAFSTLAFFGPPHSAPVVTGIPAATSTRRMDDAMARAIAALRVARSQADRELPAASVSFAGRERSARGAPRAELPKTGVKQTTTSPTPNAAGATPAPDEAAARAAAAPMMSVVSSLADAVKAIREARTDEDFVKAEDRMRAAREAMQNACASGSGAALCDSAREIGQLGY